MLRLYNTMVRDEQAFEPRHGRDRVKIFTCGPSTYRRPHIGNYRTFLYEDVLVRYLEYSGCTVQRVINFTDVEDKTLEEALEQGRKVEEITSAVADHFARETRLLAIKLPPHIPRSSTSVDQAVELIQRLLEKGCAYWHEGNVFFDALKFEGFGKLYGLDLSGWPKKKVRFKRDTYNGRRWNLGDFILWHGESPSNHELHATAAWDTAIGRGRPSWNIQDPAIITKHLGYTVDINCGGIDNIYRHHDYNIAIIESLSGQEYANIYMHGEHLIVDGKPMSKSRRNILYPEDILDSSCEARQLRFFLLHTHYRKKLNFTVDRFRSACLLLGDIRAAIKALLDPGSGRKPSAPAELRQSRAYRRARTLRKSWEAAAAGDLPGHIERAFRKNMDDDLHIGAAVDEVYAILMELEARDARSPLAADTRAALESVLTEADTVCRVLL